MEEISAYDDAVADMRARDFDAFLAEVDATVVKTRIFESMKTDSYGRIIGVREYSVEAVPQEHLELSYDDSDRVVKAAKCARNYDRPALSIYIYSESSPLPIESHSYSREGSLLIFNHYFYDASTALLSERREYSDSGRFRYAARYYYNDNEERHILEEHWFDRNERLIKRCRYRYDEKARLDEEGIFDGDNTLLGFTSFTYDESGNLAERRWNDSEGENMNTIIYSYDEANHLAALAFYDRNGSLQNWQRFIRDELGTITGEQWYDSEGTLLREILHTIENNH